MEAAPPAIRDGDSRRVRDAVARGELVPLESLLADAERRFPGRVLEVDLDDGEYEIEILAADGRVAELTYDARDGRLLGVEFEDD
ncbi:PepSY domain-containing protein [Arenimonas composti]|uniref:PepSY domain-containing protein n=1 Tax=Arenimonas composti TaxID=370776 RepID=UPI0005C2592E|nr:PepSY domain-containing protein [Arenimonas composti]